MPVVLLARPSGKTQWADSVGCRAAGPTQWAIPCQRIMQAGGRHDNDDPDFRNIRLLPTAEEVGDGNAALAHPNPNRKP